LLATSIAYSVNMEAAGAGAAITALASGAEGALSCLLQAAATATDRAHEIRAETQFMRKILSHRPLRHPA
jgi:hypothetical protein